MNIEYIDPSQIEKRSFEIITKELSEMEQAGEIPSLTGFSNVQLMVIKRCIHTTADFDYIFSMRFSEDAAEKFAALIREGATVVTDTNMALSGINKTELSKYGCSVKCFMADEDIAKKAAESKITRASASMEKAMGLGGRVIFVSGNAPTALVTLREAYDNGSFTPDFIIGVPVGFVNVVAAKELITETDIPYIVNSGRKGGSNVAAAIVNAMLYEMREGRL
ncbi:MAG: precorrin-8X methylmutase [Lachnospiraceae bacterium]|nr:precorrin-8X methylmutase [Lachnospiraceae bacterium]